MEPKRFHNVDFHEYRSVYDSHFYKSLLHITEDDRIYGAVDRVRIPIFLFGQDIVHIFDCNMKKSIMFQRV